MEWLHYSHAGVYHFEEVIMNVPWNDACIQEMPNKFSSLMNS